jgi:hypothetical protein
MSGAIVAYLPQFQLFVAIELHLFGFAVALAIGPADN